MIESSTFEQGKAALAALKPLLRWEAQPYDELLKHTEWTLSVIRDGDDEYDDIRASISTPGLHAEWNWWLFFETGEEPGVVDAALGGSVHTREQAIAACFAAMEHILVLPDHDRGVDTDAALAAAVEAVGAENALGFHH